MVTSKRYCNDCGKEITNTRTVYSSRCEECQKNYREEYNKNSMNTYRKDRAPRCLTELGTSDFRGHRIKDFEKEAEAVKKELKKLRLRK